MFYGIEFTPSGKCRLGRARCNLHEFRTELQREDWLDAAQVRVTFDQWHKGWRSPVTAKTYLWLGKAQYQVKELICPSSK